jgi:ABC-type branched-subunit amino acid transport system ATPase component
VLLTAAWSAALPALYLFARRWEVIFRADPGRLLKLTALALAVLAVSVVVSVTVPFMWVQLVGFGVIAAATAMVFPSLSIAVLSVVRPQMRVMASAMMTIAFFGLGGTLGEFLMEGMNSRFGTATAIGLLAIPASLGAWTALRTAQWVDEDLDHMVDQVVEEEHVRILAAQHAHLPLLAARHIDFSYGAVQVLFDVSLSVDDGEMVALLGTNGAGKSTLLRVISGLGLPSRGSVHFHATDITYMDAERRVGEGISQVPGGRAVFGSMSVVENLRVFGFTHGTNRRQLEKGIEATFEAFPTLERRRNQPASTLSGGEQQMVGLGKAFILRPRLLLIDELSLGLAPVVVSELLAMVRRINDVGTAVVLVEQSVNIALALAHHAYFMEKGEIRFDGPAGELLVRRDLLRSVFLEGASRGLQKNDLNGAYR